ncbi:hypothetical protein [Dactylosporangium sp. NPDC049140]|uniref:hypothetical protein n=1 Tax=Dactylosporangium sp. NPDC049140 TaxID=3155647 RepID=UPI00340387A7
MPQIGVEGRCGGVGGAECAVERAFVEQADGADLPFDGGARDDAETAAGHELWHPVAAEVVQRDDFGGQAGQGLPGVPEDVAADHGHPGRIGGGDNLP